MEFEKNLIDLRKNINYLNTVLSAGENLLKYTGSNYQNGMLENVDSLVSNTVGMSVWDPSLYTLSSLKNSGKLAELSSENLKIKLIEWETFYANLLDWGDFYTEGGQLYFSYLETHAKARDLNAASGLSLGPSRSERSNEELLRMLSLENILSTRMS